MAKSVQETAEAKNWPGLGREVRQICGIIGIPDINNQYLRKQEIKKALEISHFEDMMSKFESSKKLEDISLDNFREIQGYFNDQNLEAARMKFRIRTKMVNNIPGNFKNKYKNIPNGLKCTLCPSQMTQNHCIECPEKVLFRQDLDMKDLDDLVVYFNRIFSDKPN